MKTLLVLYFTTCHALCVAAVLLVLYRFRQSRKRELGWFLALLGGMTLITFSMSLGYLQLEAGAASGALIAVLNTLSVTGIPISMLAIPSFMASFAEHRGQRGVLAAFRVGSALGFALIGASFFDLGATASLAIFVTLAIFLALAMFYGACLLALALRPSGAAGRPIVEEWLPLLRGPIRLGLIVSPLLILNDIFNLPSTSWGWPRFQLMPLLTAILGSFWSVRALRAGPAQATGVAAPSYPASSDWERLGLTKREVEVASLLVGGLSYREIGERLFISTGTAKTHVLNIYAKTGAKNKLDLLRRAGKKGDRR